MKRVVITGMGVVSPNGTGRDAFARATLEGIAFEVADLLEAMVKDARRPVQRLRVDGGASENDLLMQFQADIANVIVERPSDIETTARGAAMLAGLGAGLFRSMDDTKAMTNVQAEFKPTMAETERKRHAARWQDALRRTKSRV